MKHRRNVRFLNSRRWATESTCADRVRCFCECVQCRRAPNRGLFHSGASVILEAPASHLDRHSAAGPFVFGAGRQNVVKAGRPTGSLAPRIVTDHIPPIAKYNRRMPLLNLVSPIRRGSPLIEGLARQCAAKAAIARNTLPATTPTLQKMQSKCKWICACQSSLHWLNAILPSRK